jgi:predicted nucleic acid-binding protein
VSAAASAVYVDSSALVKLVIPEPESAALRTELAKWDRHISSALAQVEVVRACARVDAKARRIAERVVSALDLIAVDDQVLAEAAGLEPTDLRSLDAIHLASALVLGEALCSAISYDEKLAKAMRRAGISIIAPR